MKKAVIICGVFLLSLAVASASYFGYKWVQKNKLAKTDSNQSQTQAQTQSEQTKVQKRAGSYEPYDESKLALAADGKVVLFFNAKWSKTSKALDQEFKNNSSNLPNNFTILSVDYDKNYALRKKYKVPFENTFVQVDASGEVVNSWSGSEDMAEVVALAK